MRAISLPSPAAGGGAAAASRAGAGAGRSFRRLVSSLHAAPDAAAAGRLIRLFVAGSSRPAAVSAFSALLRSSSPFALQFYSQISATDWFECYPSLAAGVAVLLAASGRVSEADAVVSKANSRLRSAADIAAFHSSLAAAFSAHGLQAKAREALEQLQSVNVSKKKALESTVKALCAMGLAAEAELKMQEMASSFVVRPSPFEYRLIAQCYGGEGEFEEMERVIRDMVSAGMRIDAVTVNVALASYGERGEHVKMLSWLRQARGSGVEFTARTYNAVLNSCPSLPSVVQEAASLPLSLPDLLASVELKSRREAEVLRELTSSRSVIANAMKWTAEEGKLDLHGFHAAAAYIAMLQWKEEVAERLASVAPPAEMSVVCGAGRHSKERGESPVKKVVAELMFRTASPMRLDRRNSGRFVGKGNAVRDWVKKGSVFSSN